MLVYKLILRFLAAMLITALSYSVLPLLWGWEPMVITSGSMEPGLRPGDVVIGIPKTETSYQQGEVVTFKRDGQKVTHRIYAVNSDKTLITKGDANPTIDSDIISPENVLYKGALVVPAVGYPRMLLEDSSSWVWVVGAGLGLINLYVFRKWYFKALSAGAAVIMVLPLAYSYAAYSGQVSTTATWTSSGSFYNSKIRASNPVVYYRMNEKVIGEMRDTMGEAHGTYPSGVGMDRESAIAHDGGSSVEGLIGTNDRPRGFSTTKLDIADELSVQMWVKPAATQTNGARLISRTNYDQSRINYMLTYSSAGTNQVRFVVDTENGRFSAGTTTPINDPAKWYNIVGVWDKQTVTIYVNGVAEESIPAVATAATINTNKLLRLGRDNTDGVRNYVGKMDEVAIWKKALSAAEIANLYATTQQ